MTLQELIDKAINDIDEYRHPDVDDVQNRLHEILQAAKVGSINQDHLESLSIHNGMLYIRVTWTCRGCDQSADYEIPMAVIEAPDPVRAAAIWGSSNRLEEAKRNLRSAQASVERYAEALGKCQAEHDALVAQGGAV